MLKVQTHILYIIIYYIHIVIFSIHYDPLGIISALQWRQTSHMLLWWSPYKLLTKITKHILFDNFMKYIALV